MYSNVIFIKDDDFEATKVTKKGETLADGSIDVVSQTANQEEIIMNASGMFYSPINVSVQ